MIDKKMKTKKMNLPRRGSEKQISVDPSSVSLTESPPPPKVMSGKISSSSLPCSPRFYDSSFITKHKAKAKVSPWALARQHSVALSNLEHLRESRMRRSKSCGEGRACPPSMDFDLCFTNSKQTEEEESQYHLRRTQQLQENRKDGESDKFKCGACLFLPGFSKGKSMRSRRVVMVEEDRDNTVSHRVSLEKFECGSWRSSAVVNYEEEGDDATINASNLFFDLPMELIRCSGVNDTESPITAGFVFDNEDYHQHNRKGVLKSTINISRKSGLDSCNSSRRVRFSTSSPVLCPTSPTSPCITPRLRRDRDDFNAFLEAQSA